MTKNKITKSQAEDKPKSCTQVEKSQDTVSVHASNQYPASSSLMKIRDGKTKSAPNKKRSKLQLALAH